jgi:hypothetical protein
MGFDGVMAGFRSMAVFLYFTVKNRGKTTANTGSYALAA